MITYAVEPWQQFKRESAYLWPKHWEEVAINRDKIKLDVDYEQYDALDACGALHVVAARSAGKIVGYFLALIRPHLHYATSLSAFTDVYYIDPEYRKGRTGYDLFKFAEQSLRQRGVEKIFTGTKKHLDVSTLFRRLGYVETETLFTKYIKED